MKKNQYGFSGLEALLVIVLVGIIGFTGWYVWNTKSNTDRTLEVSNAQTQKEKPKSIVNPPDQYEGWLSYTSEDGNFTFKYPKDWYMAAGGTGPSQGEINLEPTSSQASTKNSYKMTLRVTDANDTSSFGPISNGATTENFSNGIHVWTTSEKVAANQGEEGSVCPNQHILNSSNTDFSYQLTNGKYLTFMGGYCQGQRDITDLTYNQQLASQSWQQGLKILESIRFD